MNRLGHVAHRVSLPLLVAVLIGGVAFLGVFPTRTYLNQRRSTAAAETRLEQLEAHNTASQAEVDALSSDAEIERLAREQYGMAKPGEEVYHVLPPPKDPVQVPDTWPFNRIRFGAAQG